MGMRVEALHRRPIDRVNAQTSNRHLAAHLSGVGGRIRLLIIPILVLGVAVGGDANG
jgi:hypothetical protein